MSRCDSCRSLSSCPICGKAVDTLNHIGVRGTTSHLTIPVIDYKVAYDRQPSGIWHYTRPCGHRVHPAAAALVALKYNGGPLWKDGYVWQNVYWGSYWNKPSSANWMNKTDMATAHLEADPNYSGGLRQYNVGVGKVIPHVIVPQDPPAQVSNDQVKKALTDWIAAHAVGDLGIEGAYNIFLPPGVTASLSSDLSCTTFCDYHDSVNGPNGPFFTLEPYPCTQGCNQCTSDPFDTLTQGLSEELVELKTDMDPGTGWVIGNEELCDYCDRSFVCNQISTGEYVNSWFDKSMNACWKGP